MSDQLKLVHKVRVTCNYFICVVGLCAGLTGYLVSIVRTDEIEQAKALAIGLGWMLYLSVLSVFGNYVVGIVESSIVHLEEVRARVDKELGKNETTAS